MHQSDQSTLQEVDSQSSGGFSSEPNRKHLTTVIRFLRQDLRFGSNPPAQNLHNIGFVALGDTNKEPSKAKTFSICPQIRQNGTRSFAQVQTRNSEHIIGIVAETIRFTSRKQVVVKEESGYERRCSPNLTHSIRYRRAFQRSQQSSAATGPVPTLHLFLDQFPFNLPFF